jgi:hypothetical protein
MRIDGKVVVVWLFLWLGVAVPQVSAAPLTVSPNEVSLSGPLDRVQLAVRGGDSSGRPVDLTRAVKYVVVTPGVAEVSLSGLVRPLANGTSRIRLVHQNETVEIPLQVSDLGPAAGVSFSRDVVPILYRAGCSMGACHAAQYGQAGFKLSLFGFAPEQDYAAIVREDRQRRISLVQPEDSLILRKATLTVSHGGGKRFDRDSYDYEVLRRWLESGVPAPLPKEPTVVDLIVLPAEREYRVGQGQQLRILAKYSDGRERDVTLRARYDSMSDAVASVSPTGYLQATGAGQSPIMVRYEGQAKISMAIVPYAAQVDLSAFKPNNFIDELVMKRWRRLGLEPSPLSTDEEFLRRVFLDCIGTMPPPEKIKSFLASAELGKRERLIDELLGLTGDPKRDIYTNEWSAYWALKWADLIRNNRNTVGDGGMWSMHNWIRGSLRQNKPVDQFVRELITAEGSVFESGPANYYRIARQPEDLAESTAQNFLGVRLQCAKCHHHPFEVYSQEDYYSLAAFFTRVATKNSFDFGSQGGDSVVMIKKSGAIRHPRTGQVMPPAPLLDKPINADAHRDLRRPLADWITSPLNRLFAKNVVNRFWGYLMGVGLVEPIDDLRATNPASNPELLDALADHLVKDKYDLRKLMRAILTSRTYQLSSRSTPKNAGDSRFYTHYTVKRLGAEVLLDAVIAATGVPEKFAGIPAGTRAIELPDPNFVSYFLDTMGRPQRVITCECERTAEPNLAGVLHLLNGDVVNGKIANPTNRIGQLLSAKRSDEQILEDLYYVTFCRAPKKEEITRGQEIIARAPNRREGLEDVLWALLNSREFVFNH